ncbi:GNAT family N-acetyltransferase [Candidatus Margulisiibacteriota bacterium]
MFRKVINNNIEKLLNSELKVNNNVSLLLVSDNSAKEYHNLICRNHNYLRKWLPWPEKGLTFEETKSFLNDLHQDSLNGMCLYLFINYQGKIVGMAGLHYIDFENGETSLGYWISEEYQGNGIITDSCSRLIDYAFEELHLNKAIIECPTDNPKSNCVAVRLGFNRVNVTKKAKTIFKSGKSKTIPSSVTEVVLYEKNK